jgi:hypothetical protein
VFRIDPLTLYSLEDLERELGDAIGVRAFLDSYRPAKRSKNLWWGEDLISAIRNKPPINHEGEATATILNHTPARRVRRSGTNGNIPVPRE